MGIHESVKSRCKVRRIPVVDQQSIYGSSQTSERSEASRFSNPFMAGPSIHAGLGSPIREESSSYPCPVLQRYLPLDGCGSQNFNTQYEELFSSEDHNELYLSAEEDLEFEIEYEVDSMYDD